MSFLRILLRFAAVSAAGLWLGGFTLYTAFVIPIGHRHVPAGRFGFVTGEVTSVLHVATGAALLALLLNIAADWRGLRGSLRWGLLGTWLAIVGALAVLLILHLRIEAILDVPAHTIIDPQRFEPLHERYELFATLAWGAGMVHLGLAILGWRAIDRSATGPPLTPAVTRGDHD